MTLTSWLLRRGMYFAVYQTPPGPVCLPHSIMLPMGSWLIGKDPDSGSDQGQEEKGTTEHEMAGWHHWLDGHESEWTPGVGDGQGGLACFDSCGRRESDMTERLNWFDGAPISTGISDAQAHPVSLFCCLVIKLNPSPSGSHTHILYPIEFVSWAAS